MAKLAKREIEALYQEYLNRIGTKRTKMINQGIKCIPNDLKSAIQELNTAISKYNAAIQKYNKAINNNDEIARSYNTYSIKRQEQSAIDIDNVVEIYTRGSIPEISQYAFENKVIIAQISKDFDIDEFINALVDND